MNTLRETVEDVLAGGGPPLSGPVGTGKAEVGANRRGGSAGVRQVARKWFYCSSALGALRSTCDLNSR